jgi:hypothetical protein
MSGTDDFDPFGDDQSNDQNDVLRHRVAFDPASLRLERENQSLRMRLAALEQANVVEHEFRGPAPSYYLNAAIYLDDTLFEAGTVIETWEVPDHQSWVPQNDPARRAMEARLELVTYGAERKALMDGRAFNGLPADALDDAMANARYAMPQRREREIPVMTNTDEALAARRGPGRPRKVVAVETPAMPAVAAKS